jgi:hypothetical protein
VILDPVLLLLAGMALRWLAASFAVCWLNPGWL